MTAELSIMWMSLHEVKYLSFETICLCLYRFFAARHAKRIVMMIDGGCEADHPPPK